MTQGKSIQSLTEKYGFGITCDFASGVSDKFIVQKFENGFYYCYFLSDGVTMRLQGLANSCILCEK